MAKYLYQDSPDFMQIKEVKQIKQKLDIPITTEQVVKDGVEKFNSNKKVQGFLKLLQ